MLHSRMWPGVIGRASRHNSQRVQRSQRRQRSQNSQRNHARGQSSAASLDFRIRATQRSQSSSPEIPQSAHDGGSSRSRMIAAASRAPAFSAAGAPR